MHFYSPSPLSMGYIPRITYRPAFYLDDESSSALALDGLCNPAASNFFSPELDAETRYRRALHELHAAEEEFEAHTTLRRARRAAILREQAAHRERALAIQAEVERIERARALQVKLAEEYELPQHAHQAQVAFDRTRHQKPALLHGRHFALERPCALAQKRFAHSEPVHRLVFHDNEVATFDGLLRLFSGAHPKPDSPLQQSSSPAPAQPSSAEPQPSEKQDAAGDSVTAILDFLHGLAAHAKDAASESEAISKPSRVPQSQATPTDEKGKGKAKAERTEPATGPTFLQALFGSLSQGPSDQEINDIELAIKRSLEDRDAADAKKAGAAKVARSTSGASSSRVKLDGAAPPSNTPSSASSITSATSKPIPTPVSPLTTIRAIRNQLSTLESTFKFPAVLDFDDSVLAVSPNNAPLRAYENTLNGLLGQLDAIESDGDEEVRNMRREVVKEVEKALEDLERKVSENAPKALITNVEVKGYDVEAEELQAPVAEGVAPVGAISAVSPGDIDVDLAISEGYLPSPPAVSPSNTANTEPGNNAITQAADDALSLDSRI